MNIIKGPFQIKHQAKVLGIILKATVLNQVTWGSSKRWYLALLNLQQYVEKLEQVEKHSKKRKYKKKKAC